MSSIFYSIFRICIFVTFCCVQSVAFCRFLVPFQRIFQHFYSVQPPIFSLFSVSFLAFFHCYFSLFFVLFAVILQQPLSSFCSFILVKVVFCFLVLAICYCNQSILINIQLCTPFPDFSHLEAAIDVKCQLKFSDNHCCHILAKCCFQYRFDSP